MLICTSALLGDPVTPVMTSPRVWPFVIVFKPVQVEVVSVADDTLIVLHPDTLAPLICIETVKAGEVVPPVW